jgi:predicted DNA-binding transcriptional regulator AlpA
MNFDEDVVYISDITSKFRVSRKTIYNWIATDLTFPKPYKIGLKLLWKKSDIEAYIESKKVNASEPKIEKNEAADE